ncbi:proline dehydrogenase family protein [Dyadobacter psychrotolerans]|uniref:Proline dehydrogenase n=1 Tax=Dyadobacter psychrotolerans TaxID=2541721 RepID=A0A4R5DTN5_9BACT|nr:proline dehydrogenase family protein [Dyadobacter psychrotolerans]TDE14505.1 proline dehydrogenase [Dyadobacter psychrotolerans]
MEKMFEDSEHAFAYKSDGQLRKAYWLFKMMKFNWLISFGTNFILAAIKWRLPVIGILKNTLYSQFVGGETLEKATPVVNKLGNYDVDVILDYGAEAKEGEANFDLAKEEFIKAIRYSATQTSIPFISLKITALARFELLEKLNSSVTINPGAIAVDARKLTFEENKEWQNVLDRTYAICEAALNLNLGVLIDAEESWIQNTIDGVVMLAMNAYNQKQVTVYNTIQLYRSDKLDFLQLSHRTARQHSFLLGVKLVRGAYMEKERAWAQEKNQKSPIQPDKSATDADFNKAIDFCFNHLENTSVVVATHNEYSNLHALSILQGRQMGQANKHVHFSQLYGMSDNITFNLAKEGYNVSKYLPYGSVADVIPYLLRRAQENSSVAGQTGRELFLLGKEMDRRGLA